MWLKAEDVEREVESWIEWSRANLPVEGDIPPLDWLGPPSTSDPEECRHFAGGADIAFYVGDR